MSLFLHHTSLACAPVTALRQGASRVIVATIERPQGNTGIHTHTRALIDGFTSAGIETELCNPFAAGAKWLPLFAVRRLILKPVNETWGLRWYRRWHCAALRESLTRALLRRETDVVIAQCPVSAHAALEVRRRLKLGFRIALVCHFNYSEATEYRERGELNDPRTFERIMRLESQILRGVDSVIYVSNWARDVVERDRGIEPRLSCVIHNGITRALEPAVLTRRPIGLGADDLVLMNVGSLEPRKNQIGLLHLFAKVRQTHPAAKLVLVGDGLQRGEIESKIRQLGLTDNVAVLGHRTDVPALLTLADVYVHYSKLENGPMILLEAARAGLPIAAIPTGGVAEMSETLGELAHLHEGDLDASLAALDPLLRDPALRQSRGQQAKDGFEAHFTREAMVRQYLNALHLTCSTDARAEVVR